MKERAAKRAITHRGTNRVSIGRRGALHNNSMLFSATWCYFTSPSVSKQWCPVVATEKPRGTLLFYLLLPIGSHYGLYLHALLCLLGCNKIRILRLTTSRQPRRRLPVVVTGLLVSVAEGQIEKGASLRRPTRE